MRSPKLWLLLCTLFVFSGLEGQSLKWGRSLGNAEVLTSAQFSNGDILIAGNFKDSLRLDNSASVLLAPPTKTYGFFARLDTNGSVIWSHALAGEMVKVQSVSLGINDSIVLSGLFTSNVDLDPTSNSYNLQTADSLKTEVFVAKYGSAGNFVIGGNFRCPQSLLHFGGHLPNSTSVAINSTHNNIVMAVPLWGASQIDLDPGPDSLWLNTNPLSGYYSFSLIVLDNQLNYSWHKVIQSQGDVRSYDVNINADGDIHIIGTTTRNLELDGTTPGPEIVTSDFKLFWLSLSGHIGNFQWVQDFGAALPIRPNEVEVIDPVSGSCYILARFDNGTIDLDKSSNNYLISGSSHNNSNDFIAKFDKDGRVQWGFVVDDYVLPQSLTVNEDNVVIGGGYRYTSDFNHGIRDSLVTNTSSSREKPFVATYDSQGQFLSVFTLDATGHLRSSIGRAFSLPGSSSIIAMLHGNGGSVIDIDPDTLYTVNINLLSGISTGIASYSFPCVPATALSRDSFPTHYSYCANEWADLYLPTRASGYSQIRWEADTGSGFHNLDSMQLDYHIVNDNLRVLTQDELDTIYYRAVISNDCGSDTTETVSLYVRPSQMDTITYQLCNMDTVNINGTDYYYITQFTDSASNTYGCDSVTFHKIESIHIPNFIYHQGNALVTASGMDSAQWVSCPDYQPIPGANDTIFFPSDTGHYAAIIYKNGCSDTSICTPSTIGLNKLENQIEVYPNPSSGKIYIQHSLGMPLRCKVRNMQGQLVEEIEFNNSKKFISINASGMVFIEIYSNDDVLLDRRKVIILQR